MKDLDEMTAEELIATSYNVHQAYEFVVVLRNKLKEAITPNPDEITIKWCVDDVIMLAEQKGYAVPTIEQAREVLRLAKHYHDADVGISWVVLDAYLDEVIPK